LVTSQVAHHDTFDDPAIGRRYRDEIGRLAQLFLALDPDRHSIVRPNLRVEDDSGGENRSEDQPNAERQHGSFHGQSSDVMGLPHRAVRSIIDQDYRIRIAQSAVQNGYRWI
jgi:hypothetical protein